MQESTLGGQSLQDWHEYVDATPAMRSHPVTGEVRIVSLDGFQNRAMVGVRRARTWPQLEREEARALHLLHDRACKSCNVPVAAGIDQ